MQILGLVDIPIWLLLIVTTFLLYYIYMTKNYGTFKKLGVDGPPPKFPLGNLLLFFKKGFPAGNTELYKKYNRIFGIFEGRHPVLTIGQPELVKDVMVKQFNCFVNRRPQFRGGRRKPTDKILTTLVDDHWKFVRNTLTPTFSGKKLRHMTPLINTAGDRLVKHLDEKVSNEENIDIKRYLSGFTLDVISSTAFGMDVDSNKNDDDPFVQKGREVFNLRGIGIFITLLILFPFAEKLVGLVSPTLPAAKYLAKVLDLAINERKKNPGKYRDFLEIALSTQKEAKKDEGNIEESDIPTDASWTRKDLTDDEIISQSVLFLLAGFETTSASLTYTLYHLAIYPEVRDKALSEVDKVLGKELPNYDNVHGLTYLDMCLSESLRLYPPASRVDRVCRQTVKIGNIIVPKGMVVAIPIQAIHMDPEYWPNPEKYDPERFTAEAKAARDPFTFLPFGHGPRNCIGMRLAQLEQKICLGRVLQKFKPVVCEKTQIPLKMSKIGNLIDSKVGVWIKLERRE